MQSKHAHIAKLIIRISDKMKRVIRTKTESFTSA